MPGILTVVDLALIIAATVVALTTKRHNESTTRKKQKNEYCLLRDSINQSFLTFTVQSDGTPGNCRDINARMSARTGYSDEELLTMSPERIIAPERLDDFRQQIEEACANGQALRETLLHTKTGETLPVELYLRIVTLKNKKTGLLFIRDISDPKRVEESLRDARATLRAIATAMPVAIITLDLERNVQEWNAAAEFLFGWREFEVYGRPLPFIPESVHEQFVAIHEHIENTETVTEQPLCLRRKDNVPIDVILSATPLQDASGTLCGAILALTDATERTACQARLDQAERAMALVSETKKAMFRSTTECELLREVCETICTAGGYSFAWIGFLDDAKTLMPTAWSGDEKNNKLASLRIVCGNGGKKTDPVLTAVRTGTASIIPYLFTDERASWLNHPLQQGATALGVIPLLLGIQPIGVLVIYSERPEIFSERDIELLTELSDDLSFGIETMRIRDERERAQAALTDASHQWRTTFDAIIDPVSVVRPDGVISRCNRAASLFFGKDLHTLIGLSFTQAVHERGISCDTTLLDSVLTTGKPQRGWLTHEDRWYTVTVDPILAATGVVQGAVHVISDITDRKTTEEELKRNYSRLQSIINDTIIAITKIAEMRDPYTAGHEKRVSDLACAIARKMQFSDERLEGLRVGGLLHDIGKLYVPAEMLSKTGKLSEVEFGVIKAHTQAGYEVLKSIDFPWPIAQMVYQHHERLDGSGYPNGIAGDNILLEARILAVADVVESMASHRPYRPARGLDQALAEVQQRAGVAYDADVVAACVSIFNDDHYTLEQ